MSINARTDLVSLSLIKETTKNVTPTNPGFFPVRVTSIPDFMPIYESIESKELTPSAERTDTVRVSSYSEGKFDVELSLDSFDEVFEGVFRSNKIVNEVTNRNSLITNLVNIEITDATTGKIHFDSSFSASPFITNSILRIDGAETYTGAIIEVTASTFTAPDYFIEYKILNGKTLANYTFNTSARLSRVGHIFQDALKATTGPNTLTTTATDFATLGLTAYQWVKIGSVSNVANDGFDTAANNEFVRVSSIATNVLTLDSVPEGWAADTNAGAKKIAIFFDSILKNGVTDITTTFELGFLDHTPVDYEYYKGGAVSEFSLNSSIKDPVTGSISLMFAGTPSLLNARMPGAYSIERTTGTPINAANNIYSIYLAGNDISYDNGNYGSNLATQMSYSFKSNVRGQGALGAQGYADTTFGKFIASGSLKTYFQDNSLLTMVSEESEISVTTAYKSNDNRFMIIDYPRVKLTNPKRNIAGTGEDVETTFDVDAFRDNVRGFTASICVMSAY